eukprot:CAMPEP_0184695572 /NCGR_PEP_ID=MMETSP0313-20130426/3172_1 /TAXON_ID=2792 /ORGANISM="Porphyridium aerugineum, Strain SAG 1380-2" /LENGTH=1272 /DNA_ID=CAMNT_0027154063 /DNA_START=302 /DNA_END=4120 /DNA_ORIENTATION=+
MEEKDQEKRNTWEPDAKQGTGSPNTGIQTQTQTQTPPHTNSDVSGVNRSSSDPIQTQTQSLVDEEDFQKKKKQKVDGLDRIPSSENNIEDSDIQKVALDVVQASEEEKGSDVAKLQNLLTNVQESPVMDSDQPTSIRNRISDEPHGFPLRNHTSNTNSSEAVTNRKGLSSDGSDEGSGGGRSTSSHGASPVSSPTILEWKKPTAGELGRHAAERGEASQLLQGRSVTAAAASTSASAPPLGSPGIRNGEGGGQPMLGVVPNVHSRIESETQQYPPGATSNHDSQTSKQSGQGGASALLTAAESSSTLLFKPTLGTPFGDSNKSHFGIPESKENMGSMHMTGTGFGSFGNVNSHLHAHENQQMSQDFPMALSPSVVQTSQSHFDDKKAGILRAADNFWSSTPLNAGGNATVTSLSTKAVSAIPSATSLTDPKAGSSLIRETVIQTRPSSDPMQTDNLGLPTPEKGSPKIGVQNNSIALKGISSPVLDLRTAQHKAPNVFSTTQHHQPTSVGPGNNTIQHSPDNRLSSSPRQSMLGFPGERSYANSSGTTTTSSSSSSSPLVASPHICMETSDIKPFSRRKLRELFFRFLAEHESRGLVISVVENRTNLHEHHFLQKKDKEKDEAVEEETRKSQSHVPSVSVTVEATLQQSQVPSTLSNEGDAAANAFRASLVLQPIPEKYVHDSHPLIVPHPSPLSPLSYIMRSSSLFSTPRSPEQLELDGNIESLEWQLEPSSHIHEDEFSPTMKREKSNTGMLSPSQSPAARPPKLRRLSGVPMNFEAESLIPEVKEPEKPTVPQFYFPAGKDQVDRERREMSLLKTFLDGLRQSHIQMQQLQQQAVTAAASTANSASSSLRAATPPPRIPIPPERTFSDPMEVDDSMSQPPISWPDFVNLVVTVTGLPSFMCRSIFNRVQEKAGCRGSNSIPQQAFINYYMERCIGKNPTQRLMEELVNGAPRSYLIASDFKPLLNALLATHPGLMFLQQTPEFQQRYAETVIERIFYMLAPSSHCMRLTLQDLERHRFYETLKEIDMDEDINRERRFFSYEHFYVLYCRFWELDSDHDLLISKADLLRYGEHSLTSLIVDRIFAGAGRPRVCKDKEVLTYIDFVWFCLSEEDKTSRMAISYWFHCLDLDGDGVLSLYELEQFYKEQVYRMECLGHEPIALRDVVCQILDMVKKPITSSPALKMRDIVNSRLSAHLFNLMFNLNKLFQIEARDPLQIRHEHMSPELTPWDRFAAVEYLRLSSEEEEAAVEAAEVPSNELEAIAKTDPSAL